MVLDGPGLVLYGLHILFLGISGCEFTMHYYRILDKLLEMTRMNLEMNDTLSTFPSVQSVKVKCLFCSERQF